MLYRPEYAMYLAVLPKYRIECVGLLREHFGERLELFVSDSHLDQTVKTGVPKHWYRRVQMIRIGQIAFLQVGHILKAFAAHVLVVDLNPRSLTAWLLLATRRLLRMRTLVWGHVHPQAGTGSPTAKLRLFMRRLSNGTISYTYSDRAAAIAELPAQVVWVAPNSLYRHSDIRPVGKGNDPTRAFVLYVGRVEQAKKCNLLIEALAILADRNQHINLRIVGTGAEMAPLKAKAVQLGVDGRVDFTGWVDDLAGLASAYESAFCTVSPGFAGLGLTQSLGFGIPMIVADNERHSPEIELAETGGVSWFTSDCPRSLADEILRKWETREHLPLGDLVESIRSKYSADAMAEGLKGAFEQKMKDGSPV